MRESPRVNEQIKESLTLTAKNVSDPSVVRVQGAGKAYLSVAQSTAIAVQDSVAYLRSISMLGATAVGVASAKMIESGRAGDWKDVIREAQHAVNEAAETFKRVGESAAVVVRHYPDGAAYPPGDEASEGAGPAGEPDPPAGESGFYAD